MRILHITRDFPPRRRGGLSTAVGGMVRACTHASMDCAVISFDDWRPRAQRSASLARITAEHGVPIVRAETPGDLAAAHALATAFQPDVVHVHHAMLWDLAADVRAGLGTPAVAHVHVAEWHQRRLRGTDEITLSLAAEERALAGADAIIAPSRAVHALLAADHPALAPRVHVIGLGMDDTDAARRAANAPRIGPTVLHAGRFADMNGTAELLAALPALVARAPAAQVTIAGGVPGNRKAEARWRRRWADAAPPEAQAAVRFTGWLGPDELAARYAEAAVLICPSRFETFGLVVLEAMLHGVAVVATRAGGVAELIEHERTGLVCDVGDMAGLIEATAGLLEDAPRARALGQAAARAARRDHAWPGVVTAFGRLYARLAHV